MILKLRKKFIKITMISVICVLFGIIAFINVFNYMNVRQNAVLRLDMLTENGGQMLNGGPRNIDFDALYDDFDDLYDSDFDTADAPPLPDPDDEFGFPGNDKTNGFGGGLLQDGISAESRYDARYFTVTLDENGTVLSTDTRNIASISESDAGEYAAAAYAKGKDEGFYKHYRYETMDADEDDTLTYVFLNCERELSSFWNFLIISIIISIVGVLLVFLLVLFLSKKAIRPIAENYKKQKQFITDAGHELKTPLTIIGAYAEMIEMDDPDNEYAIGIHNQVKRLTDLTNNLIYLSKTEEGEYALNVADFSLSEEVCEALIPYYDLAKKENKTLSDHIQENVLFKGDQQAIRRLITLLMDNALKYTNDAGSISVLLERSGNTVSFEIQNTVDEIEKGDLDILFERFYRRDASRNSATGGSGIGLSTAKAIAESHKGVIHASSPDGKSFRITIQWKL